MIDLQQFCGKDPYRPYLHTPFSEGNFTYATNGHVLVRVPKVDGIGQMKDRPEKFAAEKVLKGRDDLSFVVPSIITKCPRRTEKDGDCMSCGGSGTEHDCPDCECTCESCDGSGRETHFSKVSTEWAGAIIDAQYMAMMLDLPGIRISSTTKPEDPIHFEFDGGIGAVMPMRGKHLEHVIVFGEPKAA